MHVLVFGTFDGLHEGHRAMLEEARTHGETLTAVVPPDEVVERLKGRKPRLTFSERVQGVLHSGLVNDARAGDNREGEYAVLSAVNPDVVAFGYDQEALRENFLKYLKKTGKTIKVVTLKPFAPETYKSSKIV